MLDCLLRGGTVIDGTGEVGKRADVGFRNGKIAAIGTVDDSSAQVIDVSGQVVCPGFIDVHTHYDAQMMWDPFATPSCFHGVTTVIGGNCGFGTAPLDKGAAEYIGAMLAVVEGIPRSALDNGLTWDWGSFGEWLGRLDGRIGVNVGFLVGHSVLRRLVMGEDAVGGLASAGQIEGMIHILRESLTAGSIGFSSSWAPTHVDGNSEPVPSRAATADELVELATATGLHRGTTLAFIPGLSPFSEAENSTMIRMSSSANRPLNWNTFRVTNHDPELAESQLTSATIAPRRGARIVALAYPALAESIFTFLRPVPLTGLPGWSATMRLPVATRMRALGQPEVRERLARGASAALGKLADLAQWEQLEVVQTFSADNEHLAGRSIKQVAAARGRPPFDTILDITLADELRTVFSNPPSGDDPATWQLRSRYWGDPRTLLGGSDAGAHLDALCNSRYTTDLVGNSVRERGLLSLERAVQLITDIPARLLGLDGRGRLAEGNWADLVVFDPTEIRPGPIYSRQDLPGQASRLFADAFGIEHVFVNGVEIVRHGRITGDLPGTVLRSAHDLSTVTARPGPVRRSL